MAVGRRLRTSHGANLCRGLRVARGREAALPSRGQPVVERSASRECLYESWLSTWPTRPIVCHVLSESSVSLRGPKEIGHDESVRSAVSCPRLPRFEHKPILLGSMRWVDVAGRSLRRTWIAHWRRQYVEVLPLVQTQPEVLPPPRPPRAVRSHHRWSWQDRLACNAWSGPPQQRITEAFVPTFLASN